MSPAFSFSDSADDEDERYLVKVFKIDVTKVKESNSVENNMLKSPGNHLELIWVSDDEQNEDKTNDQVENKIESL